MPSLSSEGKTPQPSAWRQALSPVGGGIAKRVSDFVPSEVNLLATCLASTGPRWLLPSRTRRTESPLRQSSSNSFVSVAENLPSTCCPWQTAGVKSVSFKRG